MKTKEDLIYELERLKKQNSFWTGIEDDSFGISRYNDKELEDLIKVYKKTILKHKIAFIVLIVIGLPSLLFIFWFFS